MCGQVAPESAVIRGNDTFDALWTFAPRSATEYSIRVALEVYPAIDETATAQGCIDAGIAPLQRLTATVVSRGTTGALVFNPPAIDFGCALVRSVKRVPLVLENTYGLLPLSTVMAACHLM